jgi:hypothetical protein
MMTIHQTTEDYLSTLIGKGFPLQDEEIGFIYFGKKYTDLNDYLINLAIEVTLKLQRNFDGSFYIAILEGFKEANLQNYQEAENYLYSKGLLHNAEAWVDGEGNYEKQSSNHSSSRRICQKETTNR